MPRGGGKGGTLLRACSFKLRYTRKNQFSFQNKCFAREKKFGGFYKAITHTTSASVRKQADAQSGGSAKRYRSDCSCLCFHCSLRCFYKGLLASLLVNANSLGTNERNELNEVRRNGVNE